MNRVILALDVREFKEAEKILNKFSPYIDIFKIGPFLFYRFGWEIVEKIKKMGKKVFLDLKLHDIPKIVREGVKVARENDIDFFTLHILSGEKALKEALLEKGNMKLLGVTLLTSLSKEDLKKFGLEKKEKELVISLSRIAQETGLNGVIASGKEVKEIKNELGKNFMVITPGIRWEKDSSDDQKRICTPREAISFGADYIVVGRSLISDPSGLEKLKKLSNL